MRARRLILVGTVVLAACSASAQAPSPTPVQTVNPIASLAAIANPTAVAVRSGYLLLQHWGNAPDGTKAKAGDEEEVHLWLVKADGSDLHELAPGQPGLPVTGKGAADWSPDGRHIVFMTAGQGPPYIYETDVDGSTPRLISTECEAHPGTCGEFVPAYCPDGKRLAFFRHVEVPPSGVIGIRDLATGKVTLLESTRQIAPNDFLGGPAWSPDGTELVYFQVPMADEQATGSSEMFIVNADGSGRHALKTPGLTAFDPAWSPDGSLIVFSTGHPEQVSDVPDIYVVHPDGTGLRQLTSNQVSGAPSWTSDGKILYFSQYALWLMDADGSNQIKVGPGRMNLISPGTGYSYYARWQPTP